jgi:hypothetical protein
MERSAEQAGYFEHGPNRLATPRITRERGGKKKIEEEVRSRGAGSEPRQLILSLRAC